MLLEELGKEEMKPNEVLEFQALNCLDFLLLLQKKKLMTSEVFFDVEEGDEKTYIFCCPCKCSSVRS